MDEIKDTIQKDIKGADDIIFEDLGEALKESENFNDYSEDAPPLAGFILKYVIFILILAVAVVSLVWLIRRPEGRTSAGDVMAETVNLHETAIAKLGAGGEEVVRHEEYLKELALQEQARLEAEAEAQREAEANPDYGMNFQEVEETVTAKEMTNLRDIPSQGGESTVMATLHNGETATRIGISNTGWSKLEYNGEIYYAVSSLLTTDLIVKPEAPVAEEDDGIQTVFTACNELVSPKIEVNLRTLPSVTNPDSVVVVTLQYGEVVTRTGINTDVGWSRVEYNGQTLYCISSYVYVIE